MGPKTPVRCHEHVISRRCLGRGPTESTGGHDDKEETNSEADVVVSLGSVTTGLGGTTLALTLTHAVSVNDE